MAKAQTTSEVHGALTLFGLHPFLNSCSIDCSGTIQHKNLVTYTTTALVVVVYFTTYCGHARSSYMGRAGHI